MQTDRIKLKVEFDDGYVGQILTPKESDFGTLKDMYIFSTGDKITDANVTTFRIDNGKINVGYIDGEMILIQNGGDSPYRRTPRVAESKDYFENIVAELKIDSGKVTVNTLDGQDEYMVIQGLSNLLDYVCRTNNPEIKKIDFSPIPDNTFRKFMRGDTFEISDGRK